ncbi:alpha/beta fold hydrolase [Reichenbachiella versicolor]|uniref:alpha/beta fold hydrolase n=1 Tax=Reichenbachiella versicolor TaxID=1821036 RepID=UPI000D6EA199|nr:alpha/beta hydrolase [Reichenbachiella versicolor]
MSNSNFPSQSSDFTIVFLHGNSSSSRVFEEVCDLLTVSCDVLLIDLPGHGEGPMTGEYKISDHADYVLECCEDVTGDILLVGNSLGGHIAIQALERLTQVKGLVIFGTPPLRKPLNIEEAFKFSSHMSTYLSGQITEEALDAAIDASIQNKEVAPLLKEDFLCTDPAVRVTIGKETSKPDEYYDEATVFKSVEINKWVIYGEQDPTFKLEYLDTLNDEAEVKFELIKMENCGHYPSIEKPDEFSDILSDISKECFNV